MEWWSECVKGGCKHIGTKFEVQYKHTLHLFTSHHDNLSPAIPNISAWGAVTTVTKHTLDLSHTLNTTSYISYTHKQTVFLSLEYLLLFWMTNLCYLLNHFLLFLLVVICVIKALSLSFSLHRFPISSQPSGWTAH